MHHPETNTSSFRNNEKCATIIQVTNTFALNKVSFNNSILLQLTGYSKTACHDNHEKRDSILRYPEIL
jgi:hypothetical protein